MPDYSNQPPALPPGLATALAPLTARASLAQAGPQFGPPEEPGTDWRRYWEAINRYRWAVALMAVVGLGAGIGASRLMKPSYMAQATIWVQGGSREGVRDRGPIRPDLLLVAAGWVDLMRSYVVLDEVVRQMHLYVQPEQPGDTIALKNFAIAERFRPGAYKLVIDAEGRGFALLTADGSAAQSGMVGDSIGPSLGFLWRPEQKTLPAGRTIKFSLVTPRDAAQHLSEDLRVSIDENGNFMRIALTGEVPSRVAAVVNAVSQREVEVAAELKREKLTELTRILESQLQSAERNLHDAENALESFRIRTITLPSDRGGAIAPGLGMTRDPVFTSFFDMKVEREQLRRDREAIVRVLGQSPDSGRGLAVAGLEVIPAVQQSSDLKQALTDLTAKQAELRALRYRYTDAHPPVRRLQAAVDSLQRQTIPALARAVVSEIVAREQTLDQRVNSASQDLRAIPARSIEEARLERDKAIAENLYTTLQQRFEEARLAEVSSIPDIRLMDAAVAPQQPIKNTAPRLILMGLVGGLGLGIIGAVLLDRIDHRVRYPDQVTRGLGLPILGTLPRLTGKNGRRDDETAHIVEALRSIRLNLTHAYGAAGPLLVTITSPGVGDGKSFLSSNLAIAFADAGIRTLLIDGDLRRGALHRVLKTQRKPGLTDYLSGEIDRDAIVQKTPYPALSFIGGGTRKTTAPELLGSPPMMELIAAMRPRYSVILVDSPPLGAAVDPFVLSTITGNLMLVLRTGATDGELAKAKLEIVDRLPVRILGAVLNDVKPEGVYRYYGYLPGYGGEEEKEKDGQAGKGGRRLPTPSKVSD
jgi:tyrosine-protein kinase Etk/Wzc